MPSSRDLSKAQSSPLLLQLLCAGLLLVWALLVSSDPPARIAGAGLAAGGGSSATADLEGWRYSATSSGVALYARSLPGSKMLGVRGVAELDGVGMPELMTTFFDISLSKKWVADLAEYEEYDVKKSHDGTLVQRYRVAGGMIVKDRQFVLRRKVKKGKNWVKVVYKSFEDDARFPLCKGCIRSVTDPTTWLFTKTETGVRIDLQAQLDPRGSLSPMLVNFIQRTWPAKSIRGLVRVAKVRKGVMDSEWKGW